MKRYCQTLELYNDSELIRAYVAEHQHVWPEIKAGIREVGILDTVDEFDWIKDNERLAKLPRQAEWEAYMSRFQRSLPGQASHEKWKMMERIFKL